MDIQYFDPAEEFTVVDRRLPHWVQSGTLCFITWRTHDSMPTAVVARWIAERDALLRAHGIVVGGPSGAQPTSHGGLAAWREYLHQLPQPTQARIKWQLTEQWDSYLDECHGACLLRRPELSQIVDESLMHFDGDRYELLDYVVMPNHVHLLAAFPDEASMLPQCASWKRFTAVQINRALKSRGQFWQEDSFDHLVRSQQHFERYRRYIKANPTKCNLPVESYRWYSKPV